MSESLPRHPKSRAFEPGIVAKCAPLDPQTVTQAILATGFDPAGYRNAHVDLQTHLPNEEAALDHFLHFGLDESRTFPIALELEALAALCRLPFANDTFRLQLVSALANNHVQAIATDDLANHWRLLQTLERLGARPYFLIGDSHAMNYKRGGVRHGTWLLPLHVNCTAGSALGLGNPASRSGYGMKIRSFLRSSQDVPGASSRPVLWKFGQVDAEFVHVFKRIEEHETTFDLAKYSEFCERSVRGYVRFLEEAVPHDRRRMSHVVSIFPPALADEAWAQGYFNAHVNALESNIDEQRMVAAVRTLQIPDRKMRTRMHGIYNELLANSVRPLGFNFVDDFSPLLGADGVVSEEFIRYGAGHDHHLDFACTRDVIESLLWQVVKS